MANIWNVYGDIEDENYSIEREAETVYVHLDRHHEEDSWGYCIDGYGCIWFDSMEELDEDYEGQYNKIVFYYNEQLQD